MLEKNNIFVCIDESDREIYERLTVEKVLKGKNRHKFLFAMAYGVKNNANVRLKNRDTNGYWRFFSSSIEERAMVFAAALNKDNSLKFNTDEDLKQIIETAEEYAHGGIQLLGELQESIQLGTYWKRLEKNLFELFDKISLQDLDNEA